MWSCRQPATRWTTQKHFLLRTTGNWWCWTRSSACPSCLPPWSGNVGKRLVRAPKVYVRDSGLTHALLGLPTLEAVLSHPIAGQSWEAHVLEQLIAAAPRAQASFYRTSHGAECDLVLTAPSGQTWACEIKRSSAPSVSRGFYEAAKDVGASRKLLIAPVHPSSTVHA